MDLATIIGLVGAFGVLIGAILIEGSHISQFLNGLATLVVLGGALTTVLVRYPLKGFGAAMVMGIKESLFLKHTNARDLIDQITELGEVVRKSGPLGLEKVEVEDEFLAKGVQMIADGYDAHFIQETLERERDLFLERLEEGSKIYKVLGEAAPGMGMVGTIIGLVSMFSHMDDPKKIGPGMAIALLTTLYGAVFANVVFLPIGDKLANKKKDAELTQSLIIDGIVMVRDNKSPKLIREILLSYLPHHHRPVEEQEAA